MTAPEQPSPPAEPPARWEIARGAALLALALLLLLASALALTFNLSQLAENRAQVVRTNTILRELAELRALARAAETGQRGFVLTGERRYIEPYERATDRIWTHVSQLKGLIIHPAAAGLLRELQPLLRAKLDELERTVALRERDFEAALSEVRTDVGQELMERIDATMDALEETERDLLAIRAAQEERSAVSATRLAGLMAVLALVSAMLGSARILQQRADTHLFESDRRFRDLAENIQEVFWMSDPRRTRLLYANPAFERVWGRRREAAYHDPAAWLEAILPEDRPRPGDGPRDGPGDEIGDEYRGTYRIRRPDGSVRWIRDRGWPVRDAQGGVRHLVGVAEDVTEIREAQEALVRANEELESRVEQRTAELTEVNLELDAFAYTVSHDLRAPLRAIHGYTEALVEDHEGALSEEGRHYLHRIGASALRMEELIRDILAYSRLSRAEVGLRPLSLDALVRQALSGAAAVVEETGARIVVEHRLPDVRAHPPILAQVLDNLLSNAMKFVAPGTRPEVRVSAQRWDGRVRLWVEDNGIGIAPEDRQRIFLPFQRLHGPESYPGTGIGLGIVRKSVERMGGRCGVEDRPGGGSRFWVELQAA